MNIVNTAKKIKNYIIGNTKEKKLEIILEHLIDNIELKDDLVIIKTKKNIAIQNDGHLVLVNSGCHVMLSKEIHLNPKIEFNPEDMNILQASLDEAQEKERLEHP